MVQLSSQSPSDQGHLSKMVVDVFADHFALAFDGYVNAVLYLNCRSVPMGGIRARLASISSAIHSFACIEALISRLVYSRFMDQESKTFIQERNRPYLVRRFLSQITSARILDKIEFLAEDVFRQPLEQSLSARLREFNALRNILLHGRLYEKWLLIGPTKGSTAEIVDEEDSYDWAKTFPQTKFAPTIYFLPDDARKAFQILLDILRYVSKHEYGYEEIETSSPHFLFDLKMANFDAMRLLEQKSKDLPNE